MSSTQRCVRFLAALLVVFFVRTVPAAEPPKQLALDTMKRATTFMVDKVAYRGGYLWGYLPDMSRRWGEMEAKPTMIWLQPPGTASMGHLFLDAYHATNDEYYYKAAQQVGAAIMAGQQDNGGWNYVVDFAGEMSPRQWYDTIGRNGWRLEEFQHYYGNATFDDQVTTDAAKFLLRLYVEKHDAKYELPVERASKFVLDSQYPNGAWPQRYPKRGEFHKKGLPDYTSYYTFNDDVVAENISFLTFCYEALHDTRLIAPIRRAMDFFLLSQQPAPQAGWSLQYSLDLKPSAARSYEPKSLATHTTATNVGHLIEFYRATGDPKYLARVPEALDWLDSVKLARADARGRTHPTFIELGSNKPLYVHRRGSNVANGEYYVDYDPTRTIGHYSSTRLLDVAGLRKRYEEARTLTPEALAKSSPLAADAPSKTLPRFFAREYARVDGRDLSGQVDRIAHDLNDVGYWPAPLAQISNPYHGDGSKTPRSGGDVIPAKAGTPASGDFATTYVGDETDTSPFTSPTPVIGISMEKYLANMNVLIYWLDSGQLAR
jgi:PelA/Pel-15E family pectate lyase